MARQIDPLTRDRILAGQIAGTPIPDGTGHVVRRGAIVSAADNAAAMAESDRMAVLAANTGPRSLGGYAGDGEARAAAARLNPATNPNLRPGLPALAAPAMAAAAPTSAAPAATPGLPQLDAETAAYAQQLLARRAERPDRVYTPETIARATPAQIRGEAAALNAGAPARAAAAQSAGVSAAVAGILGDSSINPAPTATPPRVASVINSPGIGAPALPPVIGPGAMPLDANARPSLGIAAAAGPNMTTDTGLPAGAIGYTTGGRFVVDMPGASGPQTFANEAAARATFAGLTSPISPKANRPAAPALAPASAAAPAEIDTTPLTRALAAYRQSGAPLTFDALDTIGRLVERATPSTPRAPAPGSITLPSGRVIEGITDPTGNFRVIEPPNAPRENLSDLGRLIAERDAAIQADRLDVAQTYDERIKRLTAADGGQQPMTLNIGGVPITIGGPAQPAAQPAATAPRPASPASPAAPAQAASPARQFTAGQRVRQNGITYQYDGRAWNPVAQ